MSSFFSTYLQLGFEHISDIEAYDHMLFIIALCAIYRPREWKRVAILVTAFTIGHSITLALAVFQIIEFKQSLVEILIPITILLTCLYNMVFYRPTQLTTFKVNANYALALGFGLIHGMGFSNFLRAMLMPGEEDQLGWQLLAFNIGLELGQLLIVGFILIIAFIALQLLKIPQRWWIGGISSIVAIFALQILISLV